MKFVVISPQCRRKYLELEYQLSELKWLMFKTAEIHFLTNVLSSLYETKHKCHYVSAGQYHSIKQSTVPARSQLSIINHICFLFVNLLICDHTVTIMRGEVVLFCELVHFKYGL